MDEARTSRAHQRERTRARILTTARQLFSERGYDRTTIRDVGRAAGVDGGLVMHYFGSKSDLFAEAASQSADEEEPAVTVTDPVADQLLAALLAKLETEPVATLAVLRSMLTHPEAEREIRASIDGHQRGLADAIGTDDASVRAALVSAITTGVVIGRYLLRLDGLADAPPEQVVALLRPCLRSLAEPAGTTTMETQPT